MSRNPAQLQFDTIAIEGGLFTSEWLGQVASFAAPGQADADYQIRAGFTLREEIALAWRSVQALWVQFDKARGASGHDAAAITHRFVTEVLKQAFDFQLHATPAPVSADGRSFPIRHFAFGYTVPVVVGSHAVPLDAADSRWGDPSARRRRSAFGLLQEYLNAQNTSLWGIAFNGLVLRIARDNASLTRPNWLEADFELLCQEERFAEFSVLWLFVHATRFGGENNLAPNACVLEHWREVCRDQGTRAREALRKGVEEALLTLGNGFLVHHANMALRDALANNRLSTREFFQQLLRLVYRQIFLLTIEERGVLHHENSDTAARELYAEGYGLRRLCDRAVRRNAHDRHYDLWEGLKLVWKGLATGEPRLALPALGGLFAEPQCRELDDARLENRHLLLALFHLAWLRDKDRPNAPLMRVNWRDMGPEEMGSIYESLLELVPQIGDGSRSFSFLLGVETRGNARRTSGSYYTPDSLVQLLVGSALEPVIEARLAAHPTGEAAAEALLSITVVDPACGSGHFLLAAARRIASNLARVIAENHGGGQPTPTDYRHALRQVVTHCIFGVDLNPMALELARTALWLEAYTPDAPLGFIDHHLACGNALLGVMDPKLLLQGIPDEAYKPLTGDDPDVCRALRAANRVQRKALEKLLAQNSQLNLSLQIETAADELSAIDALSDDSLDAVEAKRQRFAQLGNDSLEALVDRRRLLTACNLYMTAFLSCKKNAESLPTTEDVVAALMNQPLGGRAQAAWISAATFSVLHWRVAFAQVFTKGGFDCVLGNPPWERIKLQEEEFFAGRSHAVVTARNKAERESAIRELSRQPADSVEKRLYDEFVAAKHEAEAVSVFCHGPRYPLTGTGDVNTYALFAETAAEIVQANGRIGLILPSGIATDESTSAFFRSLVEEQRLITFFELENYGFFPGAGQRHMLRFALMTIAGSLGNPDRARFVFQARSIEELHDERRVLLLSRTDIERFNPSTQTCPVFRTAWDMQLCHRIYGRSVTIRSAEKRTTHLRSWNVELGSMFHMSADSESFVNSSSGRELPLYEAKLFNVYDHRWATSVNTDDQFRNCTDLDRQSSGFTVTPRYWVTSELAVARKKDPRKWLLAFRSISNSANARLFVAAILPDCGLGNSATVIWSRETAELTAALCGMLLSVVFDYVVRQKAAGTNLNFFIVNQLPVISPECFSRSELVGIVPRVLELTYTAHDVGPFYDDVVAENQAWDPRTGPDRGRPWGWNPERRALLRAELDAIYAHLYGLTRDELRYVLDPADIMGSNYPSETFRVLKDKEIRQFGEYRTRRLVLEAWDRMFSNEATRGVF